MSSEEQAANSGNTPNKKERSPSFPFIGLSRAIERAGQVYGHARRHEARVTDVAEAWGLGAKSSSTLQTIAALLAFGLLEDQGSGESRKLKITDLAFKALEDQRPGARAYALAQAALKPKLIQEYYEKWRMERPADGICISELRIDRGFTEEGAKAFLRVFDDTIGFTTEAVRDMQADIRAANDTETGDSKLPPPPPPPPNNDKRSVKPMEGERELTTGMLAKDASFRLIVSGNIGVKEIERLIKKLELDKEILADQDDADDFLK
jgi:hypothetical protein